MRLSRRTEVVLVTAPDVETARDLAKAALEARLVACVNLMPGIESHYWWDGKLECTAEVLLVMKTATEKIKDLEQLVKSRHPYDTPEFIVLSVTAGSEKYLDWVHASVEV